MDPNGFWPNQAVQEFLPNATEAESKHVRESMVRMHEAVLKRVPINKATKWYAGQVIAPGSDQNGKNVPARAQRPLNTLRDPVGYFTYVYFSPSPQPNLAALALYGELLTGLSEAIVENACSRGKLENLIIALGKCRSILQSVDSDADLVAAATSFGTFFTVETDVLDWDRMSMLCAALYLCASEGYSRRVIGYCDLLCERSKSNSSIRETARIAYDVPPAVRAAIRDTLKPFLRPEWGDSSAGTATQRMAHTLDCLIKRLYDLDATKSTRSMQSHYDLLANQPLTMLTEATRTLVTGDVAKMKLYFSDAVGDNMVCLFGLYRLACRDTIWLDSWLGAFVLSATLYQTPQRLAIKLIHRTKDTPVDAAAWARVRTVFDAFTPPAGKGKAASANAETVSMQQYLHFLGLRLYDPEKVARKRASAEGNYLNFLKVCTPPSDTLASAFAAVCFLLQLNTSDGAFRVATAAELNASENARTALQKQHESLQQKADRQQTYADDLTRANVVLENETYKLQEQIDDLEADNADLRLQIEQLLDLLDKGDDDETEAEATAEAEISFPADISPCTAYVFGGHPNFQSELRRLIPGLRLMDSDQRFDKKALGYADIVFLQTRHMSHSVYFTVMDACGVSGVPVHYLKDGSAKRAAAQIVQEIQQLQQ